VGGYDLIAGGGGAPPMSLSVDDEITMVEVAVILIGIAITWAVYRRAEPEKAPEDRSRTP